MEHLRGGGGLWRAFIRFGWLLIVVGSIRFVASGWWTTLSSSPSPLMDSLMIQSLLLSLFANRWRIIERYRMAMIESISLRIDRHRRHPILTRWVVDCVTSCYHWRPGAVDDDEAATPLSFLKCVRRLKWHDGSINSRSESNPIIARIDFLFDFHDGFTGMAMLGRLKLSNIIRYSPPIFLLGLRIPRLGGGRLFKSNYNQFNSLHV